MTDDRRRRYEAAERLLPHRWGELVVSGRIAPSWIDGTDRFWYAHGGRCLVVDPDAGTCTELAEPPATPPDDRPQVVAHGHDLALRDRATGAERRLTFDGVEGYAYGAQLDTANFRFLLDQFGQELPRVAAWSPDGRHLVTFRTDQRSLPAIDYVQAAPPDGARPRHFREHFAMAGEEPVPAAELVVVDTQTGELIDVGARIALLFLDPITSRLAWWSEDGSHLYFVTAERGDRVRRLHRFSLAARESDVVVEERSKTHVDVLTANVRVLRGGETLWWSERSGWGHLYVVAPDGETRAVTSGAWTFRDLVHVDEAAREIVFTASGREAGLDPYARQLYRAGLDGGEIVQLTDDGHDHAASASPSGRFLVDVVSWCDAPDTSVLRSARDGSVLRELASSDISELERAGWSAPERFTVKAADGTTDLYGILLRPHGFDPSARYAVLDDIYPTWTPSTRFGEGGSTGHAALMAALGLAVVIVNGRGTPYRGKAFFDQSRGEHAHDYLDDHVAAIRQLAETRPWLDLDRVGIYGHSGGGRASTLALLRRPGFFKVAVSSAGNHDDLLYHPAWAEKYVGLVGEADYRAHANATYAGDLEGKLLLVHGELDNNVHPYMALRLTDALIAANKDFDLLLVPNADHYLATHHAYWIRRRWDYFVRHLLGEEPPAYRIADIPFDPAQILGMFAS